MENKYREAFNLVKHLNYASEGDKRNEWSSDDVDEAHKTLQELVDKATPKKPKVVQEPYDDGITDDIRYIDLNYCDTCGSLLAPGKCCSNNECRQAIDWSKDE